MKLLKYKHSVYLYASPIVHHKNLFSFQTAAAATSQLNTFGGKLSWTWIKPDKKFVAIDCESTL